VHHASKQAKWKLKRQNYFNTTTRVKMRIGKASRRLRSKAKPPALLFSTSPDAKPKYSSQGMIVGQVQSNVVSSVYWPRIVDAVTDSLERYADLMVEYDVEVRDIMERHREEEEAKRLERADDADVHDLEYLDEDEDDEDDDEEQHDDAVPKINLPPSPVKNYAFTTDHQLTDLIETVLQPTHAQFTTSSEWKVHANAAKFERLLDEKYGPFRPFVDRYPQIERTLRSIQRKYAKGRLSPFRSEEDQPMSKSTAIILLFMMQRNGVRWEALALAAVFLLVGLQPWALVALVTVGHRIMMGRKARRVGGMKKNIVPTEPYYAIRDDDDDDDARVGIKDLSDEEERRRRNDLLRTPVGIRMDDKATAAVEDIFASTQEEAKYDVLVLGSGPSSLYTAALLSRAGKKVLVLCTDLEDASGCVAATSANGPKWDGVPFDLQSNDISHASKQQRLLAPALCSTTDPQGGIRLARIGSERDGFAHTVLSIPGCGTDSHNDAVPFVLHAGGVQAIAEDAAAALGDSWPASDGTAGESNSAQYLEFCNTVNATASKYYLDKLIPDEVNKMRNADLYQQTGIRYASGYLNKLVPLNGHVRALLAGMGMKDENLRPGMLSMAAHVTNVSALCSSEGLCYPVGGPRAVCKALESVVLQNGGKVLTGVDLKEFIFEEEENDGDKAEERKKKSEPGKKGDVDKKDGEEGKAPPAPQCIGVALASGREVRVREDGAVISMLGFIPTFVMLLNDDIRTKHGVPRGLPALSERRPLLKVLVGLRGTADELSITGADWYRLPNACRAFDETNPSTGEIQLGEIGIGRGSSVDSANDGGDNGDPSASVDNADDIRASDSAARRGKHSKKGSARRNKFDTGVSWIKVSFPSAKDPSWHDRYDDISTCVITIEADDDFVTKFDSKPSIFSNHKVGTENAERMKKRVLKDLYDNFPQLEGKVEFSKILGPIRAGLSHKPERYAAKGIRPETLYPGLFLGGSDLTVGDSFSGAIVGGWLAANAAMGYTFVDYLFLQKHIVSDLEQFMIGTPRSASDDGIAAVPLTPKPEEEKSSPPLGDARDNGDGAMTAESSKEE